MKVYQTSNPTSFQGHFAGEAVTLCTHSFSIIIPVKMFT